MCRSPFIQYITYDVSVFVPITISYVQLEHNHDLLLSVEIEPVVEVAEKYKGLMMYCYTYYIPL
jgi:hypothetical protein